MKVLLTGGLGYIGSHTAVELLDDGYEVEIVDNLSNSKEETKDKIEQITGKKVVFYKEDLCDLEKLDIIFKKGKYNAVIHFAGLKAVGESVEQPLRYYETNLLSTINLLKVMRKYDVKKLIFSSSACVYSTDNELPFKETGKLSPLNPYGRTKMFIEEIIKDECFARGDLSAIILRYFNPIGAHKSGLIGEDPNGIPNNLMPYITRVALGKLDHLNIFGHDYHTKDGTCIRDYIHVVDLARGHKLALDKIKDLKGCEIYNLGTGTGYSVLDVVNTFNSICGDKVHYEFAPRREGDSECNYADANKAKKGLNFTTKYSLKDMCESAYNYEKNNTKK